MNYKTTIGLAVALVVVVGGLWIAKGYRAKQEAESKTASPLAVRDDPTARPLLSETIGDPIRIELEIKDQPRCVFVSQPADEGARGGWKMIEPVEAAVQDWPVRNLATTFADLKYSVKYEPGQAGAVTPDAAGLNPSRAVVTLIDDQNKSARIRVGDDAGPQSAYVQIGDAPDVYLVQASLKHVLKENARDYRDLRLVNFVPDKCVRLEIEHHPAGEPAVAYALVKRGTDWVFEAPFDAVAVGTKIRSVLAGVGRLSAMGWAASEGQPPAAFGLDTPELIVRATVEETVEPPAAAPTTQPAEPEVKTTVYEVRVSALGPLGQDDRRYVQVAGDPAVAMLAKSTMDTLVPNVPEWREMRVASAEVMRAERIDLTVGGTTGQIQREAALWRFADGVPADAREVTQLLNTVRELKAQSFVPATDPDASAALETPEARLVLTLPGDAGAETIEVGGFADPRTKRLRYVRAGSGNEIARVLQENVEALLRSPTEYHDRQLFGFTTGQLERVALDRTNPATGQPAEYVLEQKGDAWLMVAPVEGDADTAAVQRLASSLASLRAVEVLPAETDPAGVGLEPPDITVTLTRQPPEITKLVQVEPQTQPAEGQGPPPPTFRQESVLPEREEYKLVVSRHEGKVYGKRFDAPAVYVLDPTLYDVLTAELRARNLFDFEAGAVRKVTVQGPDGEDGFVRDDGWKYAPEPDIPVDAKKIDNFVVQLADLKAERFVAFGVAPDDLSRCGLDNPQWRVTVQVDDEEQTLLVSPAVCDKLPGQWQYARMDGVDEVFLVSPNTIQRFRIALSEFAPSPTP
jgi:hypothetical protein